MRLTSRTGYAAQALFDLAFHCAGRSAQAKEIALRQGIPLRYLEQVLRDLRRAGMVEARRGPRGGYGLRLAPEAIRLRDVVDATSGPADRLLCPEEATPGAPAGEIPAMVWRELSQQLAAMLDAVTLQDLVERASAEGAVRGAPASQMYFI